MANEETIRILEDRSNLLRKFQHIKEAESVEISKNELNAPALFADQYRKEADAIDLAIRALKGQPIGEPLTLDQLREMDGQPVWIEGIGSDSPEDKEWALVFCKEKFCRTSCGNIAIFGFYGIGWLAYAYPPAHIDREAWDPCGFCQDDKKKYGLRYCQNCGRPLTEEAWAMLEKRLRGCQN